MQKIIFHPIWFSLLEILLTWEIHKSLYLHVTNKRRFRYSKSFPSTTFSRQFLIKFLRRKCSRAKSSQVGAFFYWIFYGFWKPSVKFSMGKFSSSTRHTENWGIFITNQWAAQNNFCPEFHTEDNNSIKRLKASMEILDVRETRLEKRKRNLKGIISLIKRKI